MLSQDETLILSDNRKYSVVYTTKYKEKDYVYLIDQDDYTNSMFCEYDNNDGLEEVTEPEIIETLLKQYISSKE